MKYAIYTLGCKVNAYESEYIDSEFRKKNYEKVDFNDFADIYIINTCTVTNNSDVKSRKIIRQAYKRNSKAVIVAMGCYVQMSNEEVSKIDGVSLLIGTKDKSKTVELVEEYIKNKKQKSVVRTLDNKFEDMFIEKFETKTRAFVKIQDGCNNFCSYCIIPYSRGDVKSKKKDLVLKEIKELIKNNHREIVLTGIHTGNYGVDINESLSSLIKEILKIEGLKRLRISSIEITELDDDFFKLLENETIIADHMHIPLQSGSNKILALMNRKYNIDYFKKVIERLRIVRPDMSITTDIIVGFPNENETDFKEIIENITKINFSKLHVFPYSKRKGTKASIMKNQIDGNVKKERVRKLLYLSKELEEKYIKKFIGKELEVIIEEIKEEYAIGHTTNYLKVKFPNKNYKQKDIVKVEISEIENLICIGKTK